MATNAQISRALKLIQQQREAAAAAAAAQQEAENKLQMQLGEVLLTAAQKPRSKWAEFRSKPLTELLAELGLIDAEVSSDDDADTAEIGGESGSELGDIEGNETTVSLPEMSPIQDGRGPSW